MSKIKLYRKIYDMKKALIPVRDIKEGTSCAVLLENRGYRGNVICPGTVNNDVHQVRLADFGTPHSFTELFRMELVRSLILYLTLNQVYTFKSNF